MITSLLSLSFLESICVACTESLRTLPTGDLSLCFRIFFFFEFILQTLLNTIRDSGFRRFFFFLSLHLAGAKAETGKFPCSPFLREDLFPLYSHTKDSILCCLSFMRMLDPHFGLIFALIMLSLMINSLRINEIWCYYPNSLGLEPCFFPSNRHKVL